MNNRIKELRKELGLTQQEFADRLNIKRGAVANYEVGRNVPIDAVISLICREFSVNRDWLESGIGEKYRKPSIDALRYQEFAEIMETGSPSKKAFLGSLLDMIYSLPDEKWEYIYSDFLHCLSLSNRANAEET